MQVTWLSKYLKGTKLLGVARDIKIPHKHNNDLVCVGHNFLNSKK